MSIRSLFEFNHDKAWRVAEDPKKFLDVMQRITWSGNISAEDEGTLDYYGVTYYGSQHHSDPSRIEWSGNVHATGQKPKVARPKVFRHDPACLYGIGTGDESDWCTCQRIPYRP